MTTTFGGNVTDGAGLGATVSFVVAAAGLAALTLPAASIARAEIVSGFSGREERSLDAAGTDQLPSLLTAKSGSVSRLVVPSKIETRICVAAPELLSDVPVIGTWWSFVLLMYVGAVTVGAGGAVLSTVKVHVAVLVKPCRSVTFDDAV